jgi:hypothetical protein
MLKPKSLPFHGVVAEFDDPEALLSAAEKTASEGYTHLDAYTPFPVHGLTDAIGFKDAKVSWTVFFAGVVGCMAGFGMQIFFLVIDYPHNVGGRGLVSWPSFIPCSFELTILFASFGAVLGMILFNGLPRPHHPIFSAPRFERASQDRFFLCIEGTDPKFDVEHTEAFLRALGAQSVSIVENEE